MLLSTPSPFWEKINDSLHTAADMFYASVISSYRAIRLCVLKKAHSYKSLIDPHAHLAIGTIATLLLLRSVISCFAAIFFVIDAAWSDPRQSWQRKCFLVITAILCGIFPYGLISAVAAAVRVVMHAYDAFNCAGSVMCGAIFSVCSVPSIIYLAALDVFTFWAEVWTCVSDFAGLVFRYSCMVFVHLGRTVNAKG
ncbi:MAG: hypothetical protein LQ341_006305 [Variospora aurantia]|nr:MAG: hypothetical protein LQ341_006305 [Variospora aurantia]